MPYKVYYLIVLLLTSALTAKAQTTGKSTLRTDTDTSQKHALHEIVVSASRTTESILKSPVSIESVNGKVLINSASPSFFDAIENVKGVQMITPSLGFKIINTRGFANTTNVRFTQLVDGIDNQAPHIGAPIGNAMGPSDLDIERIEIVPGTASALYGLNAINGLANFITKNPFTSSGIIIQQKTGVNHINDANSQGKLFSETSVRIAHTLSSKLAFKINGTYSRGYDWIADDHTDLNATANQAVGIGGGVNNPAYDPTSGYGNESANRRTITLQGKQYLVARTGYFEKEVADYNLKNFKADIGINYRINPHTELAYTYRTANLGNIYQRSNRFTLKKYMLQQHALEFKHPIVQAKAYLTSENTGESYNLRSTAENLDRGFKSDNNWYTDFTQGYNQSISKPGTTMAQALTQARHMADAGRLQPGTAAFNNTLNQLANINNWDMGSALRVKDDLLHLEGQIDLARVIGPAFKQRTGVELVAGADHRRHIIQPDGNYFVNPEAGKAEQTFSYGKTGGFIQAGQELLNHKLKLVASLRADKNDYFSLKWNSRFAAVIMPDDNQSIRFSYQSGSRFPSIFEAYSNVNSGGVKRIGGLRVMSNGVLENAYLRNSIDQFQKAVINDFNTKGTFTAQSIELNKGLLTKNYYNYLFPESIKSFEMGYKAYLLGRSVQLDADLYYNKYNDFIAQVEMNVPRTTNSDSIPYYLNDKNKQDRYRVWTNSRSEVYNYGGSLGLSYNFLQKYTAWGNISYAKLDRTTNNDGLEDGFNTPEWTTNVSLSGERIFNHLGFNITYKHQSSYYWQSFLVNGTVKAYGNIDAQVNTDVYQHKFNIKAGGTNVLNHYYYSFLGGPYIGGLYYVTLTYRIFN